MQILCKLFDGSSAKHITLHALSTTCLPLAQQIQPVQYLMAAVLGSLYAPVVMAEDIRATCIISE